MGHALPRAPDLLLAGHADRAAAPLRVRAGARRSGSPCTADRCAWRRRVRAVRRAGAVGRRARGVGGRGRAERRRHLGQLRRRLPPSHRRVRRHHAPPLARRRDDLGLRRGRQGDDVGQRVRDGLPRGGRRRIAAAGRQAHARDAHADREPGRVQGQAAPTTSSCRPGTTSTRSAATSRSTRATGSCRCRRCASNDRRAAADAAVHDARQGRSGLRGRVREPGRRPRLPLPAARGLPLGARFRLRRGPGGAPARLPEPTARAVPGDRPRLRPHHLDAGEPRAADPRLLVPAPQRL